MLCIWAWFILWKGHGGKQQTNLSQLYCSRRICMLYSSSMKGQNKMYPHMQIRRPLQPCNPAVFGVYFVKLWYLYTDSAPTTMMYLPCGLSCRKWLTLIHQKKAGRPSHFFPQWAYLWGMSVTGTFNSKAHRTKTSAWTAEYIHQLLVEAASAPGLERYRFFFSSRNKSSCCPWSLAMMLFSSPWA